MTPVVAHRYSLATVVGAGVLVAVPLVALVALKAASLAVVPARAPVPDAPVASVPAGDSDPGAVLVDAFFARVHVVPAFHDGRTIGVKLFPAYGSPLARAGLERGDVVVRINGIDLRDPGATVAALTSLRDARVLTFDILRHGRPGTISIDARSLENP